MGNEKKPPTNVVKLIADALLRKEAKKPKVNPTLANRFNRRKGDKK